MNSRAFCVFIVLCFVFYAQGVSAQENAVTRSTVTELYKGKPYYVHFVKSGETLPAIAKAYNVTIDELKTDNQLLQNGLQEDMVLMIRRVETETRPAAGLPETPKPAAKPAEANPPEAARAEPAPAAPEVKTADGYLIYIVKSKETLYSISRQFNLTIDDILSANPGFEGLKDGMQLRIPNPEQLQKLRSQASRSEIPSQRPPDSVIVKQGETLYSIARAHNTTVDELIDLNRASLNDGLKAGMTIWLREPHEAGIPAGNASAANGPKKPCFSAENLKKTYNIALLLPLVLDEAYNALDAQPGQETGRFKSYEYFQFYAGFMLAADTLETFGLHAGIQVLDADKLNDTLMIREALRKNGIDKMDLLVGPMFVSSFGIAARFARKNHIGIVNPLSKREHFVESNPYVFKVQPPASALARKLVSEICLSNPQDDVILVRTDNKELNVIADEAAALLRNAVSDKSFSGSVNETTFSSTGISGVKKLLSADRQTVVVLFSNKKETVSNFISLLNPGSLSSQIFLIGMDGWDEFDLEPEFLVNLNFRQLSSTYIDYDSEATRQFVSRFRSKYGAYPDASKFAFLGYDIGMYFLTSLMWYGSDYCSCLAAHPGSGLQYDFSFEAAKPGDGFQNTSVNMLKLLDYKLVKTSW